jgi:1,4-dihydroxy-2-naphthoate octaprenyltransferase
MDNHTSHADDHGHGHDLPDDIISENSVQDKMLILLSLFCLLGLLVFGAQFATMPQTHEPEAHEQHENHLK